MDWGLATAEDYLAWMAEKGSSRSVARRLAAAGTSSLKNLWEAGTRDPRTFYHDPDVGEAYIRDLSQWHASGSVDKWLAAVDEVLEPRQRVLDFGAGIGTYSLLAAEKGCVTEACEVNRKLREYTLWRSKRHALGVHISSEPFRTEYDVVLCLDVAEHVADPPALARTLASIIPRGGKLVLTYTFHKSDGAHPMHHGPEHLPDFLRAVLRNFYYTEMGWPAVYERQ